ncbi:MAG: aminotransferase class I/II-fold pyridoxal phosphate-dependent enzyme [Bacteroidetes bacterium]|nr:aminotransferase class I/II-fold pyridoxal phosphate-dependent enzyme [Bacteroidota bacterium]MBS1649008.1 aminotransferase class I/II-fold pyridoxal phosphate-dependent enzyme [Bacteroidota bacterium]
MNHPKLSHLAETLIGSEIVKLGNTISERIRNGEKIYNYTIGDFNPNIFPIPNELENLIIHSYQQHHTNYPPGDGVLELRKAVSNFLNEWEGLKYDVSEIQIASGGRPLIYAIFRAIVDKGDKVIYGVPSWNNNHYVHLTDGEHCLIDCKQENNFMPTAEDIAPHLKGATLLCLCTPQNPTGTTLNKTELEKICNLILAENAKRKEGEKKLYVMFDQMYWTLTYGTTQHYNPVSINAAMKEYTIFVDGISKAFAATGVRVGWSMGPAYIISKMKAILSHLGAWAPMAEQKAVAAYLPQKNNIEKYFIYFKSEIEKRLQLFYTGFIVLKNRGYNVDAVAPQAAIYLTIKVNLVGKTTAEGNLLQTQSDVTDYILSEAKLAIVPFTAFGATNSAWYRLSVGTSNEADIAIMFTQLEMALAKLK